jgi:hypothetical protein
LDQTGALLPTTLVAVEQNGAVKQQVTADPAGQFVLRGLEPGTYTVRATLKGFAPYVNSEVTLAAGEERSLDIPLFVTLERQQITVSDTATSRLDLDPTSNVGALVLKGADLEALSDDPDDLAADLQALAGPAAGPNGGQIYIDGFSGGRLPPKQSIREIRINQSPFAAEFDRLGFGRIEIFTRPGTDKIRGTVMFNFGDSIFNSRNPFAPAKPDYQQKGFNANLSGPLNKKSSYFLDFERRQADESSVVNALILDSNYQVVPFSEAVISPAIRTNIGGRFDYQLTPNHTLVARYSYRSTEDTNNGVGNFTLASRATNSASHDHTLQITETAVLNARAINETRFQYIRRSNSATGDNSSPSLNVLEAFHAGGASLGLTSNRESRYEMQNFTSLTRRAHLLKFGVRLRGTDQSEFSDAGYNGAFTFTSLEAYRITRQGLAAGLTMAQIRALGGGPSQFAITAGASQAGVTQWDAGLYVQDDWRLRPNFSLSYGLRYETQTNIRDRADFAPRASFAWGLGGGARPKTVIRGGAGIFYDRFSEDLTLQAIRLNGVNQRQYLVANPPFFDVIPPLSTLSSNLVAQTIRQVYANLRSPYMIQAALGVERQLPRNITLAVNYTNTRGLHVLRSRNINAPLAGTYDAASPGSGVRPYPGLGNLYLYEASGMFKQSQLIVNVNARINPRYSLFGFYSLGHAHSNTDGAGSFPQNQYDESSEWSRAGFDVRHRMALGGQIAAPWGWRFNPFVTASSAPPFNITVGRDLNGDSLFNDRPAFATDLARASVVSTPWGVFDTQPLAGQTIIPRNYGTGHGQFTVNLRLSKTWSFGERNTAAVTADPGGERLGPPGGGFGGGMPGGGPRAGGGGGRPGGGPLGDLGGSSGGARYSLTFSLNVRNLFNHVNLGQPVGNLSSPLFGQSNSLGGFGGGPGGFGGGATANRRLDFQLRFSF